MDRKYLLERIKNLTHPLEPILSEQPTRIQKLNGIRCVAFDFYGTMFISGVGDIGVDEEQQQSSYRYFEDALAEIGLTASGNQVGKTGITTFEKVINNHIQKAKEKGINYPEPDIISVWLDVLVFLHEQNLIKEKPAREHATFFAVEFEFRVNDIWPVPNLKSVLHILLKNDLQLGIISNSQFYTPIAFETLMGTSPSNFGFNANLLIWSYKVARKKPSKSFYEVFVKAARKEGLQPQQILYVGNDIRKDIRPAKSFGMHTALYVGDQRSIRHRQKDLEKEEFKPDLIIDDLSQLPECL